MNNINFNYIRTLSRKTNKTRPILHSIRIQGDYAYWTNGDILVRIGGYNNVTDGIYCIDTFRALAGSYPDLSNILNREITTVPKWVTEVYKNQVVYSFKDVTRSGIARTLAVSTDAINHIEKLVKGYKFRLNDVTVHGSTLRITFDGTHANGLLIIFSPLNINRV